MGLRVIPPPPAEQFSSRPVPSIRHWCTALLPCCRKRDLDRQERLKRTELQDLEQEERDGVTEDEEGARRHLTKQVAKRKQLVLQEQEKRERLADDFEEDVQSLRESERWSHQLLVMRLQQECFRQSRDSMVVEEERRRLVCGREGGAFQWGPAPRTPPPLPDPQTYAHGTNGGGLTTTLRPLCVCQNFPFLTSGEWSTVLVPPR